MSSKTIDKENSQGLFFNQSGKNHLSGLMMPNKSDHRLSSNTFENSKQLLSTPKGNLLNSLKESSLSSSSSSSLANTGGKSVIKRAFGVDLLNTANRQQQQQTVGKTPQTDTKIINKVKPVTCNTSSINLKPNETGLQEVSSSQDSNLDQIERFIGSRFDNYDDIFSDENSKLSDIFSQSNLKFTARLPLAGELNYLSDRFQFENDQQDNNMKLTTKKLKRKLKKIDKQCEMNQSCEIGLMDDQQLPELPMPHILELDF